MRAILLFIALSVVSVTFSQVTRCYTDEQTQFLREQFPQLESPEQFEQWIQQEMLNDSNRRIIGGVYQIPVVVHVIHSGEAVGSGTNVSYAAIQSQIDVLNEDFRKMLGTPGYNTNPVGADTQIEFCLAKRRPDGSAFPNGEDGVNRILYTAITATAPPYTTTFIDNTIKPYTYNNGTATATRGWHPGKYMNIWLCNISGGILGYAQFPESPLGGMGCGSPVVATDGVVFLYNSIGKSSVTGYPGPYNEGRTATHEVGHWLGLRHIWGDGNCTATDYCNDTPPAAAANFGCPTGTNSCTTAPDQGPDMIENYMDYTDDGCMNIFTNDQKTRMRTVLESSTLRVSLINSDACVPPNVSDASVVDIINPKGDNCPGSISPIVTIKNRGSSNLTSAQVNYKIDNGTILTATYSGSLAPGATTNVTLPASTVYLGTHRLTAYTTLPNTVTDPSPELDTIEIDFIVSKGINAPYTQDFEGDVFPPDIKWVVENVGADCYEWVGASATSISGTLNNNTAQFPGFGNSATSNDNLITPIFILPCNATAANIQFDVAYRTRNTTNYDTLFVDISEDCGNTWNTTTIYKKGGTQLYVNATAVTTYYTTTAAADWRTETVNLLSYVTGSSKNVKFRFRARGRNGNNIYIDNFKFNATTPGEAHVANAGVEIMDGGALNFSNVTVSTSSTKTITVSNTGTSNLTLGLPLSVSGSVFTISNNTLTATIAAGQSKTFDVTFTPSGPGSFSETLSFTTNDCDELTYDFLLLGTGTVNMPIADFTANATSVCVGATVTFTNASQYSSSYAWDFGPNANPTTSTLANPTVQFLTAGQHTITLVATNPYGSDPQVKANYITAIAADNTAIPYTEGFTGVTFPVSGWSVVNANSSATTWARSATVGNNPTSGNSMFFNNFSFNDGDDDIVKMPGMDLSSVSSAELVFDVAYAPYNATTFDGLEVLVSTDCGVSFTSLYSKSNTTLATAAATTTSFVPTAAQWRTETIDLNAYVGNSNLIVAFKNLSGNGQNLYVDNINVRQGTTPTSDFTASSTTVCVGTSITFTSTSTGNPTSYSWTFTGGTPSSSTAASPSVTYSAAGTYPVILTASNVNGTGTTMTKTGYITVVNSAVAASCSPTRSGTATYGITNVTLGTINNTTVLTDAVMNNYSCSQIAQLLPNTSYTLSVTVGTAGAHWVRAYIDYNNNGVFTDAGETIFAPANGTGLISANFTTPASPTLNTNLRMRVIADRSTSTAGPCAAMTRGQAEDYGILIVPPCTTPTVTSSTPTALCGTGNATISATPSAGTIKWYTVSSGGTAIVDDATYDLVGNNLTINNLSSTTTYYAEAVNGSCVSAARTAVIATVNTLPTVTSTTPASLCGSGNITLSATPSSGNINWYTVSSGGSAIIDDATYDLVGNNLTINSLGTSTTYYAEATNGACVSATRTAVIATINSIPSAPTGSASQGFCIGALVSDLSVTGSSIKWYDAASAGNLLNATDALTSTNYYASQTVSGCESSSRLAVAVTTSSIPTMSSVVPAARCDAGTVTLQGTPSTGTIRWFDASSGGTLLGTGLTFVTPTISSSTTYYAEAYNGACPSSARTAVMAAVGYCTSKVVDNQCGTTLGGVHQAIYAENIQGATEYKFEVKNGSNIQTFTTANRFFYLYNVNFLYNTTYSIRVAVKVGGSYLPFGNGCSVTTPDGPAIAASQCGISISASGTPIYSTFIPNATHYKFKVVKGSNVQYFESVNRWFKFDDLTSFTYNTNYTVSVAAEVGGLYGPYGTACTVTSPTTRIVNEQCNGVINSKTTNILAYAVPGATAYRFKIAGPLGTQIIERSVRYFSLQEINYALNTTYTVTVSVIQGGVLSPYGQACTITTPSTNIIMQNDNIDMASGLEGLELEAYPNPNDGNFTIASTFEGTFNVLNELGQVVQVIAISKEGNYKANVEGLKPGVYFISGAVNNEIITRKVVVQ